MFIYDYGVVEMKVQTYSTKQSDPHLICLTVHHTGVYYEVVSVSGSVGLAGLMGFFGQIPTILQK